MTRPEQSLIFSMKTGVLWMEDDTFITPVFA